METTAGGDVFIDSTNNMYLSATVPGVGPGSYMELLSNGNTADALWLHAPTGGIKLGEAVSVDISGVSTTIDASGTLTMGPFGTTINIGNASADVDMNGSNVTIGVGATTGEPLKQIKLTDGSGAYIDMSGGKIDISGDDVTITGSSGSSLNLLGPNINIGNTDAAVYFPGTWANGGASNVKVQSMTAVYADNLKDLSGTFDIPANSLITKITIVAYSDIGVVVAAGGDSNKPIRFKAGTGVDNLITDIAIATSPWVGTSGASSDPTLTFDASQAVTPFTLKKSPNLYSEYKLILTAGENGQVPAWTSAEHIVGTMKFVVEYITF